MAKALYPRSGRAVEYIREDLREILDQYSRIRDVLSGQRAIKTRRQLYLPDPAGVSDGTKEGLARYNNYLTRAVFYNFTEKTLEGLLGQIFTRDPQIDIPPSLEPVEVDATGGGVTLTQFAQKLASFTLGYGRAGIFVDYPSTGGVVSQEQITRGDIRPMLSSYEPWAVRNWRVVQRGGRLLLSLVVIYEDYTVQDDGFEKQESPQYRVLRLNAEGIYTQEVWRGGQGGWGIATPEFAPTKADGTYFDEIPFKFVGSLNNDAAIDSPPLDDLAELNIAHYRNSADYEEAAFLCGQPTPWFSGLTEEWVDNVIKDGAYLGSRKAILLPPDGAAGLLQAEPNMVAKEAMESKERQAVALGAKLVEQKTVQRTATEAGNDEHAQTSTLSKVAKNVGAAINWALVIAGQFQGVTVKDDGTAFDLNTEFDLMKLTPEERAELVKEWQAAAITFEEMRANLRRAGVAYLDDEEAQGKLDEEAAKMSAKAVEDAAAMAEATGTNENVPPGA